jgi:hypothetical protein
MSTAAHTGDCITVSREELYHEIWQEPMTKVAPRYWISDVGLAKVCQKHNIPRPPVGYWAKSGVGQHVEQTPLPTLDDDALQEIHFFRKQFFDSGSELTGEKITVEVPERLSQPHSLVDQTRDLLGKKANDETRVKCLDIHVSTTLLPRALGIFDALIKKWEEIGGKVCIVQDATEYKTRFVIGQDAVSISITEETKYVEDESPAGHRWRYGKRNYMGRLVLEISGHWADGLRRRWADGKQQQLETVLGSFMSGLQKWIAHEREKRLDDEIEARQGTKAAEIRYKREQLVKQLEQRQKNLEQCAANFAKSEEIRRYLATFESKTKEGLIRPRNPEGFPEWMEWAKWYADFLDPLTPTPQREEYAVAPTNVPVEELELTRRTKQILTVLGVVDTNALYEVQHKQFSAAAQGQIYGAWSEICLVLEGFGYDVSGRQRY